MRLFRSIFLVIGLLCVAACSLPLQHDYQPVPRVTAPTILPADSLLTEDSRVVVPPEEWRLIDFTEEGLPDPARLSDEDRRDFAQAVSLELQKREAIEERHAPHADSVRVATLIEQLHLGPTPNVPRRADLPTLRKLSTILVADHQASTLFQTEEELERFYFDESNASASPLPYVEHTRSELYELGEAVVAIIDRQYLHDRGSYWELDWRALETLGSSIRMCTSEPFYQTPVTTVRGTGFLIDGNRVVTANHVLPDQDHLDDVYFLFGYRMIDATTVRHTYCHCEVFEGVRIVAHDAATAKDFAVIELDREVPGIEPLALHPTPLIPEPPASPVAAVPVYESSTSPPVFAIGHALGLPQVYLPPRYVIDDTEENCWYMKAGLTAYLGGSGSPVFDAETNQVLGMVITGFDHFTDYCGCVVRTGYSGLEAPHASVVRAPVIANRLHYPKAFLLHHDYPDGETVYIAGPDLEIALTPGQLISVPVEEHDVFEIVNEPDSDGERCLVPFSPKPGETWHVVVGPEPGSIAVRQCGIRGSGE
jgi:hypothetical protein